MASLRSVRRSRRSTPLSTLPQDAMFVKNEERSTRPTPPSLTEWQEPPLRPPAPSFEDYKGLERHGVLEYMQPLGTLPTQRVKLRIKQHDHPKKAAPTKNGESAAAGMEDLDTPDPAPPLSRRSESRKVEDRSLRASSSREKNEDSDYIPHVANGMPSTTPIKAASSHSSHHGTPSSRVSHGRTKLKKAVEGAITQANEIGNPALGLALQRLFDESFHDHHLSSLLEAVLSQKITQEQRAGFQSYMRQAQREIKRISGVSKHARSPGALSKISSKSPSKDPHKAASASNSSTSEVSGLRASDNSNPTSHPYSPTKTNANNMQGLSSLNASSLDQEPPTKRPRRSNSTSSLSSVASSLSSIGPNLARQAEEDFGESSTSLPPLAATNKTKPKTSTGPRMGIFTATNKRSIAAANPNMEDEDLASKRRKLQKTFDDYIVSDSDVRTHMPNSSSVTATHFSSSRNVQRPTQTLASLRNGVNLSGADDDSEISSPTTSVQSDLLIPPPPFAGSSRRGATPMSLGRAAKAGKKSARVKMSPLKKRNGVVAGMPRAGGVRHSPIGSSQADGDGLNNNDDCSACGGSGQLACCDGCTRSYHFTCLDPPREEAPPGELWYCQACEFQPLALQVRGVFPLLLHRLQRQTPTAYKLPLALRTYYEDVITGEDGEYEENNVPSKARTRGGYDVPVDTLRLKDGKDNTILCYKCNESAMGRRELVECDFCNLHWHLDCVDPPLASAPKRFGKGTWKCPNHIDSEVALPRSASGRKYKVRRPKDPRVVEPAIQRGIKNNGIIEVEDEISEEEDQPPGTIFRLSAKAIQLDFISKIKQQRLATARVGKHESEAIKADQRHQQHAPDGKVQRRALSCTNNRSLDNIFDGRTPAERQAASSLAQFARSDPESQLSGDRVEELVSTLITEAPSIGITDICRYTHEDQSNGDPAPPASDVKMYEVNGGTAAVSTRAKAGASNKAAYAANHANTIETAPNSSILPHSLTAQEELAELLKLDATLKAKIAAIRATTTAAAI